MKILITGALGHIGSHLMRVLADTVTPLNCFLIDNLASQRYCSLFHLPSHAQYQFIQADLRELPLDPILTDIDAVVHLAASTDAASSVAEPERIWGNNLAITERLAAACLAHQVPLLFPSSTSVYGTQADSVDESCDREQLNPQSPYAACKLKEEALLQRYATLGLRMVILRFGTIYGPAPGMRFHTAVNKFCWQAATGQAVTVWQTAFDQQRPYLALDDACQVICQCLTQNWFDGEVYNVLTANHTVREVIRCIQSRIPDLAVQLVEHQIMNQFSYCVEKTKLEAKGITFNGSLSVGIGQTLDWLGCLNYTAQPATLDVG